MNEVELLKRFRDEVPEPDDATRQAVLAALMERIEAPRGRILPSQQPSRRRIALGLTAAAAVSTVALLLPIVLPRGATSAAAAELRRFAAVAAKQPSPPPLGPGQYYYLREEGRDRIMVVPETRSGAYTAQFSLIREYWLGADGSGRLVDIPGELYWPSSRDEARGEVDGGAEKLVGASDQEYGPGELVGSAYPGGAFARLPEGYDFQTLPRDPEALYEVLEAAAAERESADAGAGVDPSALGTFGLSLQLLRSPLTPSDVRSAIFEAMAYIPGINVVADRTISGIGTGTVVFHHSMWGRARVRMEFLLDPATSELIGYRETQLDREYWTDAELPLVMTQLRYSRPEVVDSMSERP